MRSKRMWVAWVVAGTLMAATSASALSITWDEGTGGLGDAKKSPADAQWVPVSPGDTLVQINGKLSLNNPNGVDMFGFYISDTVGFSASTVYVNGNYVADPQLFLFDADGFGVLGNDDVDGSTSQAALGGFVGDPGVYYLAISRFWNLPQDADRNYIFDISSFELDTSSGAFARWDNDGGFEDNDGKRYQIDLTGAAPVPEPGTMLLLGSGLLGLAGAQRRRKG